jgi:hypothetical protein
MTVHVNFVKDFPKRCGLLFRQMGDHAKDSGREVTFMISIAASGIIIPYQRLSESNRYSAFDDRSKYAAAKEKFDSLIATPFTQSQLLAGTRHDWRMGGLDYSPDESDNWPDMKQLQAIPYNKTVDAVLKHVRDSISHGNIVTKGSESSEAKPDQPHPITAVWFCHKKSNFGYLCVTPDAFGGFLEKWFAFCATLELPDGMLTDV